MSEKYTNRELDSYFGQIHLKLDRIEGQVTKTNSKVSRLEGWRMFMAGMGSVLTALIIPIALALILNYING